MFITYRERKSGGSERERDGVTEKDRTPYTHMLMLEQTK